MTKLIFAFIIFVVAMSARAGYPPTATQGNGESAYTTTFKFNFPNFAVTRSGTTTTLGTLNAAGGGTGANTLTLNNVILGNGTSAVQFVAPGSSGNMLVSNGTTWTSTAASGSALVTAPGATSPKICSAYITNSGTAAISTQVGGCFSAVNRTAGGKVTHTLTGFTTTPRLVGCITDTQTGICVRDTGVTWSSTSIGIITEGSTTGNDTDANYSITLMGE